MILAVAMALWSVGFVTWISATVFGFHGVGAVGAVIFIGVSAATVQFGLEYHAGHTETGGNDVTVVDHDYNPVETSDPFQLGGLFTILGSVMFLRSLVSAIEAGFENGFPVGRLRESDEDDEAGGVFRG